MSAINLESSNIAAFEYSYENADSSNESEQEAFEYSFEHTASNKEPRVDIPIPAPSVSDIENIMVIIRRLAIKKKMDTSIR